MKSNVLTRRELEVLVLLCDDCSVKEVGKRLGMSEKTADVHRSHIHTKVGVSRRLALYKYAVKHGLVPPPEVPSLRS